ncbi:hypothetical protein V7S43_009821 [Phytophthora oleae]|uniref:WRKY19-like zinc finger domain-containing protein n=1 Tax=Phytophthora oleae TaxID=2107226 RepID=A0ABD3FE28_9STRA
MEEQLKERAAETGSAIAVSSVHNQRKFGLPFILNVSVRRRGALRPGKVVSVASPASGKANARSTIKTKASELTKEQKKLRRTCKHEGYRNYIVHKGLCCRHGGGKKCSLEGCNTSAKHRGLCWKHGGSVKCKEDGCDKKAKACGVCWAHGGGTKCRDPACLKVAVSNGHFWAHGGGKRCGINGCIKPAFERNFNLCEQHFIQLRRDNYFEV